MAFDIVKNSLCDLIVVYKHEEMSHITLIIFITAIAIDIIPDFKQLPEKLILPHKVFIVLCLAVGNYYLFQTAKLGGELVYEQGAAVKNFKCTNN